MAHLPDDALPPDPFADDVELTREMAELDKQLFDEHLHTPLSRDERAELAADLTNLAVYQALLEPRGIRGVVIDCVDCAEPHYHDWRLLRASLEHLLSHGVARQHEPAFNPQPELYVTWDYCQGFADGITTVAEQR